MTQFCLHYPESNSNICILLSLFRLYRLLVLCKGSCFCGCISFDSYIKPQLFGKRQSSCLVVYLLIPTSNHNLQYNTQKTSTVVYLLIPTSNHNCTAARRSRSALYIFWFLHQTTTMSPCSFKASWLYIFWFLHQTTTERWARPSLMSCISFDSYIKPQPHCRTLWR